MLFRKLPVGEVAAPLSTAELTAVLEVPRDEVGKEASRQLTSTAAERSPSGGSATTRVPIDDHGTLQVGTWSRGRSLPIMLHAGRRQNRVESDSPAGGWITKWAVAVWRCGMSRLMPDASAKAIAALATI
jgi:hypothetical protein